jgi:DNA-binding transcriptional LysR family regulator
MYDWAELRHFRYLLVILEKQGFRVAAEELHTSQPNLTVQARQFQENASVRLFRKMKNGRIRPTETGIAFITLARFLLETRDEVIDALMAIERGEIGSVRFGCSPLVDQSLFRSFCAMHKEILPVCSIRPTHGDTAQLAEEVVTEAVEAAIVTLPLKHPDLRIEEIRRDRLVACLRRDNPLARKAALKTADLQDNLSVLYHPQRHPEAHERLLELLDDAGVRIEEYSRASNPSEMQMLVKARLESIRDADVGQRRPRLYADPGRDHPGRRANDTPYCRSGVDRRHGSDLSQATASEDHSCAGKEPWRWNQPAFTGSHFFKSWKRADSRYTWSTLITLKVFQGAKATSLTVSGSSICTR